MQPRFLPFHFLHSLNVIIWQFNNPIMWENLSSPACFSVLLFRSQLEAKPHDSTRPCCPHVITLQSCHAASSLKCCSNVTFTQYPSLHPDSDSKFTKLIKCNQGDVIFELGHDDLMVFDSQTWRRHDSQVLWDFHNSFIKRHSHLIRCTNDLCALNVLRTTPVLDSSDTHTKKSFIVTD